MKEIRMPRGGPSITTESYPEDSNVQPEVRTTVSEPNRETVDGME